MGTLILAHQDCPDGKLSALILRRHRSGNVRFIRPRDVAEALADVPAGVTTLLLADLAWPTSQTEAANKALDALLARGVAITWIDHHADSWTDAPMDRDDVEWVLDLEGTECGATLCAQWVGEEDVDMLRLAAIARGRDIWTDPLSEEALLWVGASSTLDLDAMDELLRDEGVDAVLAEGLSWRARLGRDVARLLHKPFLDQPPLFIARSWRHSPVSDAAPALWAKEQGHRMFMAYDPRRGTVSIRTPQGTDVAHLAGRKLGGGGHPNAAGGKVERAAKDRFFELATKRLSKASRKALVEAAETALASENTPDA